MRKIPVFGEKYTVRELQEFAVAEMYKSVPEHTDKADPKVGAILATPDGEIINIAHRGELRSGDHAEFTVLERKCRDRKVENSVIFATLEPCAPGARKHPKLSCAERIVNGRIKKVYIGIQDPDPMVKGKGEAFLRKMNIEIDYFDKDLQDKITIANENFMEQARERSRIADLEDLQPSKNPLEVRLTHFNLKDFSEDALQMYIDKTGIDYKAGSENFNRLLAKWGFIEVDVQNHVYHPTGWGILLFGKKPTDKYSQARIKFTVIKEEGLKPETEDFSDALVKIPEQIEKYLGFVFPKALDRNHFKHEELTEISIKLLREAIINAIVHRDYLIEEAQILINISPKEIVIKSPGNPIVSLEKLRNFTAPTVSRNPKLAEVFYNMGFIERRGLGMEEIQKYRPKPVYSLDEIYTVLSIVRNTSISKEEFDKIIKELKSDERDAYQYIKEVNKVTKSDFASHFKIDDKKAQRILKQLKDAGLIITEGKAKATEYVIVNHSEQHTNICPD
jgi:ATP-dependent DNA helicase RecG